MKKIKPIRDAVSLVFVFEDKLFSIVRQNFLKAFPGYTAFPGGKVDKEDRETDDFLLTAARREAIEELGFDILDKTVLSINKIGLAVSPEFNPLRFNTHFYRITLDSMPEFIVDENEARVFEWLRPKELLNSFDLGERLIVPPMRFFLEAFDKDIQFKQQLIFKDRFNLSIEVPSIEPLKSFIQVMPRSLTVPPADRTNAFLIGNEKKVLVDPSPMDEGELERFLYTIKNYEIEKIMITHHHGDHHKYAPKIARDFNLDIHLSEDTYHRILKYDSEYFDDIKIHILKEGDILCSWLNENVRIVEVPGHDEGQLALMPDSKKWFLAGDLFQGVGTVVVGGDEGDMSKYFNTLKKVISLNPSCVIPSHGIALGGTNILQKTLEHREFRESQIIEMNDKGMSIDEMVETIYFDLPQNILKYARANIVSHLEKINKKGDQ
jgi:glyoxylase-like metal-dependent hydrolase (beta-lactamase superfamily II)/8-oxo-dGTP pyrophosphatase MutT (NUDIX family)